MKVEILGVSVDLADADQSIAKITEFLSLVDHHYVVTVNPEFMVAAQQNAKFKTVLNQADLAICDGFGLVLASGGKLKRVTGVDLSQRLLGGEIKDAKIFLLGGAMENAKALMIKYPMTIVGAEKGGTINTQTWLLDNNEIIINKINHSGANILLVGFGQVKQEMWISQNLAKLPQIKVAMGVGGTFDYLSGQIQRAPKLLRLMGLEWLFRLITQPKRIGRIFNATVKFIWLLTFSR